MKKKKGLLIALVCIVVVIALAIGLLMLISSKAVIGIWAWKTDYLKAYDCEAIHVYILESDHTFQHIMMNADTYATLKTDSGTWTMTGFEVACRRPGQDGSTPFTYNIITDTLNNGGGLFPVEGDNILQRIQPE